MSEDFFGDLSKQLGAAAQTAVDKTSSFIELQKTNAKISAALHEVEKMYQVIGEMVVIEAQDNAPANENIKNLVEEVNRKKAEIEDLKKDAAKMKGYKVCAVCGNKINLEDMFCSKCGAEAPVEEVVEEETVEETEEGMSEEVAEVVKAAEEEVAQAAAEDQAE